LNYSKLSPRQSGELLKLFVSGPTARAAGEMVGVHRNTVALFFTKVRRLIMEYQEHKMTEAFEGPVKIDEPILEASVKASEEELLPERLLFSAF
jgi:transposase